MGSLIPRQTITASRFTGGARVKGKWIEGTLTSFSIKASIQPPDSKTMETLPEARRASGEAYELFTNDTLLTTKTAEKADRVTIYGDVFEVVQEKYWKNTIINNNVYLVVRITTK